MAGMTLRFYYTQYKLAYFLGKTEEEDQSGQDSTREVRQMFHFP